MEITASTKILAVIGDPIFHSMSPTMHNAIIEKLGLNYVYVAFHVKQNALKAACNGFRAIGIKGINVTIPHKIKIMDFLDEIDPIALGIGAINTIKNDSGRLLAKNTDGEGALMALTDAGFDPTGKKCVILGAGGASRAISFMLGTKVKEIILIDLFPEVAESLKNALIKFYSQSNINELHGFDANPEFRTALLKSISVLKELKNADILINTSPVGMHPKEEESPIDGMNIDLNPDLFVFDVVYNPLETKLLKNAKSIGCKTLSGINMLVNQGAAAFEWWTGIKPDANVMKKALIKKLKINEEI